MMFKERMIVVLAILSIGLMACSSDTVKGSGEQYGHGVTLDKAIPISEVFTQMNDLNGQVVRVSGTVNDLCKHKGCWMQVTDGENVLTVRFKDEAFILPASAAGRNVDFEGLLIAEKISNPLGSRSACAEGGEHSGEGACESERAEATILKVADMRYTMVSTGLVLL
ncbi:MAG: DUF4920 domain-containing protein [Candidatus Marinimicrobia bacterium]|nr:DUF4920 domain-containing protein [Candidatus Neomarinimicrobiota bacterium]